MYTSWYREAELKLFMMISDEHIVMSLLSVFTTNRERPIYISLTGLTWGAGTALGVCGIETTHDPVLC